MRSIDTNLLLYAYSEAAPEHEKAREFVTEWSDREDVALCEFVLLELYQLLRNPKVLNRPLDASAPVDVIQCYRGHPRWLKAWLQSAPNSSFGPATESTLPRLLREAREVFNASYGDQEDWRISGCTVSLALFRGHRADAIAQILY